MPLIRRPRRARRSSSPSVHDFLWPLVAVRDLRKQVITVGISSLRAIFTVDWGLISAASLIAAVPLTVIFILFQQAFFHQSLAGALKE